MYCVSTINLIESINPNVYCVRGLKFEFQVVTVLVIEIVLILTKVYNIVDK